MDSRDLIFSPATNSESETEAFGALSSDACTLIHRASALVSLKRFLRNEATLGRWGWMSGNCCNVVAGTGFGLGNSLWLILTPMDFQEACPTRSLGSPYGF